MSRQKELVVGIDLGTTGAKAIALDIASGANVGQGYYGYPSSSPVEGAHEQSPYDWWTAVTSATQGALRQGIDPRRVRAVGLSGHMHAACLVDREGLVVRPAMTWADRRCNAQVRRLQQHAKVFGDRCANPLVEAFTAPKVAWLADNEPESLARAVRLIQPKDWLRHCLTDTWGTDVSDARGTLLYDLHSNDWDGELWRLCGGDVGLAPVVSKSTEVVGAVSEAAAMATGLAVGTPVVAGASDVACCALGAGLLQSGAIYVNAGTAAQVLAAVDEPTAGNHLVFGQAASDRYLVMASVYAAGLSVRWAAETLLQDLGEESEGDLGAAVDRLALREQSGAAGVVYIPHLLGTSVPSHCGAARGALIGLNAEHRQSSIARAVLEGVAYACAAAAQHIDAATGDITEIRIGGGMARSSVWSEAMSAVHNVPLLRVTNDPSPVGAAMLAGLGTDVWGDVWEANEVCVALNPVPLPSTSDVRRYRGARQRYERADEVITQLSQRPGFFEDGDGDGGS